MDRKVFISFLGTGRYKECVYTYNQKTSGVVKFVQEALIQLIIPTLGENCQCYFFLTKKAYNEHHEELNRILKRYPGLDYELVTNIPDGVSEDEIWEIFKKVFSKIQDSDILHLDITHGFRSLPMLALTLTNYAKSLKNIQVGGIYYGAFEVLGPGYDIDQRIPEPSERKVPILDLTPFSDIQNWASAGNNFFKLGNSSTIIELAKEGINSAALTTKKKNKLNEKFRKFAQNLAAFSLSFSTCRGELIIEANHVQQLKLTISDIKDDLSNIPSYSPLMDILDEISDKLSEYNERSVENLYTAVKWCIESQQLQPAATLLQEGFVSVILNNFELDIHDKVYRKTVNGYLNKATDKEFEYNLKSEDVYQKQVEVISKLDKMDNFEKLRNKFSFFTNEIRNDINHASFGRRGRDPLQFSSAINEFYEFIKSTFPNF